MPHPHLRDPHPERPLDCAALLRETAGLTRSQAATALKRKRRALDAYRSLLLWQRRELERGDGQRGSDAYDLEFVAEQRAELARVERALRRLEERSLVWWWFHWPEFHRRMFGDEA